MTRWQANAVLLLAGATWGMGFIAQATAMDSIGPYLFIGLRFTVAALVILPFVFLEARRSAKQPTVKALNTNSYLKFSLIGLTLFAGMSAQQVGLLTTSVTNSGFLTGLYVVFTPFLVIALFREFPPLITWFAGLLSFLGIFFLSGGNLSQLVLGDVLTIISAVCWALQMVLIARFVGQSGRPLALSFVQFLVTAVLAMGVAMVFEPIVWLDIIAVGQQILFAGIFASGFAFTLQVIGQRYTTAPQAAIMLSSEAPFAALFAFWWLHERITPIGLFGCGLILLAMLMVELVPQWLERRQLS